MTVEPRQAPRNLQAEESLLGAMLLSKDAAAQAVEITDSEEFYKPNNGHIFSAILNLFNSGEAIDPVTVANNLEKDGLLDQVGGLAALLSLQVNTPSTTNAGSYARVVHENAQLRQLAKAGGDIIDLAYSLPESVQGAIDVAESIIFSISDQQSVDSLGEITPLIYDSLDHLGSVLANDERSMGTPTGIYDLDFQLGGLQPSSLTILGARPAMGKTALALNVASHVAIDKRLPVLMFSLEMSHRELTNRLMCSHAMVDATRFKSGRLSESDWTKLGHSLSIVNNAPFYIDDNPSVTLTEIRAKSRRLKSKLNDLGLIVIDYLQLMNGRQSAENRQVEVSEISRGLKILARELNVPVVALSQLSRNLESRSDKRPMLSDLRESGALEQDSDVVLFLYRDQVYNEETPEKGVAEVIISKNRNGPIGTVKTAFIEQYTRFANIATGM